MWLRHQDLVEISDFEIPRFGSIFCFLVQFFTPSLIHTSSPHPNSTFCTPKMTSKHKNTGTNSELSLNLNASFKICQTKRLKFGRFLDIIFDAFFSRIFSLSFRSLLEATRVEPRKPRGDDIHAAAQLGDVPALLHFLRVDPERVHKEDSDGPRPQRI